MSDDLISRRLFLSKGVAAAGSLFVASGLLSVASLPLLAKTTKIDTSALQKDFKGKVIAPGDPDFEKVAYGGLWNKLHPSRLPQLICSVSTEEDVATAVKWAKANNLKVAIRGGGHNWCAPSLRNQGIMIDLTNLNKVISIDPQNKKAVMQPIISNLEVQAALKSHNLAYPSGHCPPVKISGYLLSGGMSWNQGVWGPGCGSVEAIEMVDSNGNMITASADQNQDYFWAARGAGPGLFAVCTRYHLKLYDLPKYMAATSYFYPYENIVEVAEWLGPLASKFPSMVELSLFAVTAPKELADKCKSSNGKVAMVTATIFAETAEEAKAAAAPLETCPLLSKCLKKNPVEPTTFEALFDASGELWPDNLRNKVDAIFSNSALSDIFKAVKEHFLSAPPKAVFMYAVFTGKDIPAPPVANAAFSMYSKLYGGPWTMWDDAKDDKVNIAWHEKTMELIKPYIYGHYVSETDTVGHPEYLKLSIKEENLKRIGELRKKYDPTGVFFDYQEALS